MRSIATGPVTPTRSCDRWGRERHSELRSEKPWQSDEGPGFDSRHLHSHDGGTTQSGGAAGSCLPTSATRCPTPDSNWCTVDHMARQEQGQTSDASQGAFTDERGVILTRAGVDRARERIAESRARHTPEYFAALRDRIGIPPRSA